MTMKHTVLAASLALLASSALAAPPPYTISKAVALGAPDKWDYVVFDGATGRVLVAHATQIDVVDGTTGAVLGKLPGIKGAHGIAVAASGTIFADSGQTGTLTGFDGKTLAAGATVPAGGDADGMIYEPTHNLVAVMDGDPGTATLLDAAGKAPSVTVKLGGSPEFAAADGRGHVFINIADTSEIADLDAGAGRVVARFAVPACKSPHGLAMDRKTRRLFTTCINAKLLVLDADSGHVLQTLAIGHGSDAAGFDPVRNLVYSSNGDGTLSVLKEAADGTVTALGEVKTLPGARTMALDPKTGRVFLVTADVAGLRATEPGHGPKFMYKPGTVKLVFLDPQG